MAAYDEAFRADPMAYKMSLMAKPAATAFGYGAGPSAPPTPGEPVPGPAPVVPVADLPGEGPPVPTGSPLVAANRNADPSQGIFGYGAGPSNPPVPGPARIIPANARAYARANAKARFKR